MIVLYLRRWRVEEGIRFLKSELGLETVRVLSWQRLQHVMALALPAMTLTALASQQPKTWRTRIIHLGQSRTTPGEFLFYRIFRGTGYFLQHWPVLRSPNPHGHIPGVAGS